MHTHHGFRGVRVLFQDLHVVWIRRTMASATADAVSVRDPLNESGDIDYLISLGPVQPTAHLRPRTCLWLETLSTCGSRTAGFKGDHGSNTVLRLTLLAASTADSSSQK